MTNKHLAYLLATTLLAAPAAAQTGGSPGADPSPSTSGATGAGGLASGAGRAPMGAPPDGASSASSASSRSAMSADGAGGDARRPLAAPGKNQIMASNIRGTRVYGAKDENVGDVSDILLSRDGSIVALIVGVGGFLGIGQKDVAIPFQAFEFVSSSESISSRTATATTTTTDKRSPAAGAASRDPVQPSVSGSTGSAQMADEPATTGATPQRTTTTTSSSDSDGLIKLERIVLRGMTKADLEAAPEFKRNAAAKRPAK